MAKGFTPLIGLAVVLALALAAVFGSLSLANPALASFGQTADAELTERTFSPQSTFTIAAAPGNVQVTLTWTAVTGADSYQFIWRTRTSADAEWTAWSSPAAATSGTVITDLDPGAGTTALVNAQEYQFRVRAIDAFDTQVATSNTVTATPNVGPGAPALAASGTGDDNSKAGAGEATLVWTPDSADTGPTVATMWQFQMGKDGPDTNSSVDEEEYGQPMALMDVKANTATAATDDMTGKATGLMADTFSFRVRGVSAAGLAGTWSTAQDLTITQGATFMAQSMKPASNTRYDIRIPTSNPLSTLTDEIVIELEDYSVPGSIDESSVALTLTRGSGEGSRCAATGTDNCSTTTIPDGVSVSGEKISITIGDWNKDRTGGNTTSYNGVAANDVVTVVLKQSAGIKNPTKAGDYGPAIEVKATNDPSKKLVDIDLTSSHTIQRIVKLSEEDGGLGDTVMATASGFEKNVTVRFFIDGYSGHTADGLLNQGEDVLCAATSNDASVASCEFTVSTPVFKSGVNYVNAVDGVGNFGTHKMHDDQKFELKPSIKPTPASGSPGEIIQVQLASFTQGAVTRVSLSGKDVCGGDSGMVCNGSVNAQGTGTTRVTIPNWAGSGVQELKVWVGAQDDKANVTIAGPRITPTPSTVVANQRLSLVGTGFSPNARLGAITPGTNEIKPNISIGGAPIDWNDVNDGRIVTVDDSGNWSSSVDLPMVEATTGTGERLIRITDSKGRTGGVYVTLANRDFDITPPSGRVGTLAVVRGVGYPGKNDEGASFTIDVTYKVSEGSTTRVSVVPDASGRFEVQLRIPTTAAIPSTNQVEVSFELERNEGKVTDVKQHMVPEGIITLSETSGGPGSTVTVSGEGFKTFAPVESVKIGAIDITPAPNPHTDANGMMTFDLLIPGLDVGIQTIEVKVGGTTSSTGFTVVESGIAPGDIRPVAEATEDLGANLVSVWNFNNDTKVWAFYTPELAEGNTLTHVIAGESYLIRIKSDQEVILNGDTRNLTCVGDNCWNQVVW